jgi:hypothetical protein
VFFLNENASMRGRLTAGFVDKGYRGIICGQWFEDVFTRLTVPDFDDVMKHGLVLFVTCAERDVNPRNRNFISNPGRG